MPSSTTTFEVMKWIKDNGCPDMDCDVFMWFDEHEHVRICSNADPQLIDIFLEDHPVETWNEIYGIKYIFTEVRFWFALINEKYYYITK